MSRGEEIKRNAITLIARDGFGSMSLRELARESGIQVGSVYQYYRSKDEILFEVVQDYLDNLLTSWRECAPRGRPTPTARLRAFVESYIQCFLDSYEQGLVSTFELRRLKGPMLEEINKAKQAYETELRRVIQAGMESGDFKVDDAKLIAMALLAILTGLSIQHHEMGIKTKGELSMSCWRLVAKLVQLPR